MARTVTYITKEEHYVSHGINIEEFKKCALKGKSTKSALIAEAIQGGSDMRKLNNDFPGFMLMHQAKIRAYMSLMRQLKTSAVPLESWRALEILEEDSPHNVTIKTWLNANLFVDRPMRQRQLFIHGPTAVGKTWLISELARFCRIYIIPRENYYPEYNDDDYDLCVLDEFKASKPIHWLNAFLGGQHMKLPVKCESPVHKVKNLPCILLSNEPISDGYENVSDVRIRALEARLTMTNVPEGQRIDVIPPKVEAPAVEDEDPRASISHLTPNGDYSPESHPIYINSGSSSDDEDEEALTSGSQLKTSYACTNIDYGDEGPPSKRRKLSRTNRYTPPTSSDDEDSLGESLSASDSSTATTDRMSYSSDGGFMVDTQEESNSNSSWTD